MHRQITLQLLLFSLLFSLPILSSAATSAQASEPTKALQWRHHWGDDIFDQAQREDKFVILDLEAVWCHWCHVMEQTTYQDEKVVQLLKQKYITVRIDQDSNPQLLARYGDYGWPATIVFAPDGTEIVKRRGYINPVFMASMLQAIIDDPSPGPSVLAEIEVVPSNSALLTTTQKKQLLDRYFDLYDAENGGWGFIHKFINADAMDYALAKARAGDKTYEIMARQTLHAALDLIDPVWGGVYQYSDQLDWQSPHFEKIMSIQTQNLRLYSLAWSLWQNEDHLKAADAIYQYLDEFMQAPNGLFYTSQDADLNREIDGHKYFPLDDKARRALGMPRIDTNIYSRDNAWVIRSFVAYANATEKQQPLQKAIQIADQLHNNFYSSTAGYKHHQNKDTDPYLSSNLAVAQAYLSLYQSTAEMKWLQRSIDALKFIDQAFRDDVAGGFINQPVSANAIGVFSKPVKHRDEQIQLARTANLAFHYSGDKFLMSIRDHALKFMASDAMLESRFFLAGLLAANEEAEKAPVHITVVGKKSDDLARKLHDSARRYPVDYLRIDWWDPAQGKPPNNDIQFPELATSAAYACSADSCSLPVQDVEKLHAVVDKLLQSLP